MSSKPTRSSVTDARTRELERRALEGPLAQAKLLAQRIRQGSLSRPRVQLAAWAGDVASQEVEPGWIPCVGTRLAEMAGLLRLAAHLTDAPHREVRCAWCTSPVIGGRVGCSRCQGSGIRKQAWDPENYIALRIGCALGRSTWEHVRAPHARLHRCQAASPCGKQRLAVETAEQYRDTGTMEALRAWDRAMPTQTRNIREVWEPGPWLLEAPHLDKLEAQFLAAVHVRGHECPHIHAQAAVFCSRCSGSRWIVPQEANCALYEVICEDLVSWLLSDAGPAGAPADAPNGKHRE